MGWEEHLVAQRALYRSRRTHQRPDFRKKKWRELRERVLSRSSCCASCGLVADLILDHILPLSAGGDNSESNLQALCAGCNARKGATVDKDAVRRFRDA